MASDPVDASPVLELLVEPRVDRGAPAATRELLGLLEDESGRRSGRVIGSATAKTGIESVVLALGSAGVISAVVEVLRVWLSRDRPRRVRLSWVQNGDRRELELSADNLSEEGTQRVLLAALEQQV